MTRFDETLRRLKKVPPRPTALAAWTVIAAFAFVTGIALTGGRDRMVASPQIQEAGVQEIPAASPDTLSPADRGLYVMIHEKQQRNDFAAADELMSQLSNTNLLGYVLAERYLNTRYKPSGDELKLWLANYNDHPQARHIASLARTRGVAVMLPTVPAPLKGEGYTDHMGRTSMPDSWFTALTYWREGKFERAETIFTSLSADETLSDWQRSAAYYWSYRANDKLDESGAAESALNSAAHYPTTFYGLLAINQLGRRNVVAEAPEVSGSLRKDPRAIRAALLTQIGQSDDAEDELRHLYSATTPANRRGIVTLASELTMPNLQMRLAHTPGLSASETLFARFPAPQYMVDLHPVMDSALLLSVARNESGFREIARNASSGALGMMQMLPATARAVERKIGQDLLSTADAGNGSAIAERLSNPAMSARYAAEYLKMLAHVPAINNNLIHLVQVDADWG